VVSQYLAQQSASLELDGTEVKISVNLPSPIPDQFVYLQLASTDQAPILFTPVGLCCNDDGYLCSAKFDMGTRESVLLTFIPEAIAAKLLKTAA
jgi:hypothetical protein